MLCYAQPVHEYLARSAGLRDVREFARGMTPMQYKKASKAIAGIRVRASTGDKGLGLPLPGLDLSCSGLQQTCPAVLHRWLCGWQFSFVYEELAVSPAVCASGQLSMPMKP